MHVAGGAEGGESPAVSLLCAGDRVAVIAPSGPVSPDRLERGVSALRRLDLDVVVGKHALDQGSAGGQPPRPPCGNAPGGLPPQGPPGLDHLAGSDADRAADLQDAWCDPGIAAVLCARGGYGAVRLLDHLDWEAMGRAAPKPFHGSSDATALHAALGRRLGVPTSFGPMVSLLVADGEPESVEHMRASLFEGPPPVPGTHALRGGACEGTLTGGNLALLTSLLGTPYAPEPAAGRVAFLEDVGEAPYRVDRMLTQLLLAGWFDGVAGIALGTWTRCGDVAPVLAERLLPLGVPILAGLPVGHGPRQLTVRLGGAVRLDADARELRPI